MAEMNQEGSQRGKGFLVEARQQLAKLEGELELLKQSLSEPDVCGPEDLTSPVFNSRAKKIVGEMLRLRRSRAEAFGSDLFGEPAWDLLLELYLAELNHVRLSVTGACNRTDVPPTTALRWVTKLVEAGWVERFDDHLDARRSWVVLSDRGSEAMKGLVAQTLQRIEGSPAVQESPNSLVGKRVRLF
ncbi:hypothetical protein ACFQPG_10930 [Sphingomonas sp. GCM10030256]|uniref:hypothetical protein n=1 Tax=Sphingomonas sp. GCM10030256 TaxID=3273427 RepID=UPI00360822C3